MRFLCSLTLALKLAGKEFASCLIGQRPIRLFQRPSPAVKRYPLDAVLQHDSPEISANVSKSSPLNSDRRDAISAFKNIVFS